MFSCKKSLDAPAIRFAIAAVASFLCFGLARPATAGQLFGASVFANAVANDGCAVNGSYSTASGSSTPTVTDFGTGPSNEGFINCAVSFTNPLPAAGLTGVTLQAGAQDTKPADSFGHAGSATSTADLATAALHGFASSDDNPSFQGSGQGTTDAKLWDELTFSIPGATPTTITNIPVFLSVDGSGNDLTQEAWGVFLQLNTHQCFFNGCGIGTDQVTWGWNLNNGSTLGPPPQPYFNEASGDINFLSDPVQNSITWQAPSVETANDLQVEGILSVTGTSAVVDVSAELNTLANGGTVDFSNTAAINFQLPAGVTDTSASGVFGTANVPEPADAVLCGFGLVLLLLRRRKA